MLEYVQRHSGTIRKDISFVKSDKQLSAVNRLINLMTSGNEDEQLYSLVYRQMLAKGIENPEFKANLYTLKLLFDMFPKDFNHMVGMHHRYVFAINSFICGDFELTEEDDEDCVTKVIDSIIKKFA